MIFVILQWLCHWFASAGLMDVQRLQPSRELPCVHRMLARKYCRFLVHLRCTGGTGKIECPCAISNANIYKQAEASAKTRVCDIAAWRLSRKEETGLLNFAQILICVSIKRKQCTPFHSRNTHQIPPGWQRALFVKALFDFIIRNRSLGISLNIATGQLGAKLVGERWRE